MSDDTTYRDRWSEPAARLFADQFRRLPPPGNYGLSDDRLNELLTVDIAHVTPVQFEAAHAASEDEEGERWDGQD